jgi:hypothetical protein
VEVQAQVDELRRLHPHIMAKDNLKMMRMMKTKVTVMRRKMMKTRTTRRSMMRMTTTSDFLGH